MNSDDKFWKSKRGCIIIVICKGKVIFCKKYIICYYYSFFSRDPFRAFGNKGEKKCKNGFPRWQKITISGFFMFKHNIYPLKTYIKKKKMGSKSKGFFREIFHSLIKWKSINKNQPFRAKNLSKLKNEKQNHSNENHPTTSDQCEEKTQTAASSNLTSIY